MSASPHRITVRMYQVGFGDCFLLSFAYHAPLPDGRRARHVLIDFGSTRWPKDYAPRYGGQRGRDWLPPADKRPGFRRRYFG